MAKLKELAKVNSNTAFQLSNDFNDDRQPEMATWPPKP